jgi:hypothetical protein
MEFRMKSKFLIAAVLIVVIAAGVFWMISMEQKPTVFLVDENSLQIQGSFGVTVPLQDISGLELKNEMPAIGTKTNGSGLGSHYKGEFTLQDGTKARLYVDASKQPFVSFVQGGTVFYINSDTPEKTQELYDQLNAALDSNKP